MWRSAAKDNLRPQRKGYFGAQSHTPRNRCVRFVFGIAAASRNTRFQAACWALPGPDLHRLIATASPGAFPLPTLLLADYFCAGRPGSQTRINATLERPVSQERKKSKAGTIQSSVPSAY